MKNRKEAPLPSDENTSVEIVEFVENARGFIMTGGDGLAAVD